MKLGRICSGLVRILSKIGLVYSWKWDSSCKQLPKLIQKIGKVQSKIRRFDSEIGRVH